MPPFRGGIEASKRRYREKHPHRKETSHICYEWLDENMFPHSIVLHSQDSFERLYPDVKRYFTTPVSWDGEHFRLKTGQQLRLPYKAKV